ncbi:rho GTPase-activating protein 7-like isoform X3 [Nymphaea colorata]|uniref:rho GTPase-activating protein 7-like isoform X3 n=1 Tax=Nymphaea colorata TaxID=210225 RepID=UPI00214F4134|nr:rho GTPase-activating protein 7-like isoform X3 [Nymphaea colorata]
MYEWKAALENALAQAPSANLAMGQSGIFQNDASVTDTIGSSVEQWRERRPVQSLVVGRPILLALEDMDGSPSFLEKALRFIEQHGVKVEGILRQSADVEEVKQRIEEYEQGKTEFSPDEDAHVVSDCVKYILRELPSSPVPASCCTALLESFRTDHEFRVDAMHDAISETLPEPNRRLLQRVLKMMIAVASHKSENRMSAPAVAACMAPLLLRPLLAGDCELEDAFDIGHGGSAQLMAAAAAANHAHAIIATLLDEYDGIFEDDCLQRESHSTDMYSDSESNGSEDSMEDEILETVDDGYHDVENDLDPDDDPEQSFCGTLSESSDHAESDVYDYKVYAGADSDADAQNDGSMCRSDQKSTTEVLPSLKELVMENLTENHTSSGVFASECQDSLGDDSALGSPKQDVSSLSSSSCLTNTCDKLNAAVLTAKRQSIWGRTAARKNLAMDSIDSHSDDEIMIQRLEITKNDLQNKIAKEAKGNAILQASLERRKQALHERRLALEQDVARLQEQLQREKDLRATIEAGLNMPPQNYLASSSMDIKQIRAELEEIALAEADVVNLKQKAADLHLQLNQQHRHIHSSFCKSCGHDLHAQKHEITQKVQQQILGTGNDVLLHEGTKKKNEVKDVFLSCDSRAVKTQLIPSVQSRQPHRKQQDLTSRSMFSSDLVKEPFAKNQERRYQLLNELHNLDGKDGTSSHK